jgi:2-polyprenyl-6-methoxyphenol hydroxylase-like FAD-dependent oxidoreductase
MNSSPTPSSDPEVLIAGAGPTGLVLALWLARLGIRVRIIDKNPYPAAHSRALAVQSRTLEFYSQLGFVHEVVDAGHRVAAANVWVSGRLVAHAPFGDLGRGLSPFPFALIYPQDEHEPLLIRHLAELGVTVERPTELLSFTQSPTNPDAPITAHLRLADGSEQICRCTFLAGCDGARSIVRQSLDIGFPGGQYTHLFYVADVQASGTVANGELHVALDDTDFLAIFPIDNNGRIRLVGTIRDDQAEQAATQEADLNWNDVSKRVLSWIHVDIQTVNWFSTYRVHHRVAENFRNGRAFLLGDAAHIHSPVGGQGMNTGIGDAVNLAWKLANVLRNRAPASLLDTYEPERIAFARRLVATTDQAFTAVTSDSELALVIRLHIIPHILPALLGSHTARPFLFRTISQIGVNYRDSALSEGRTGKIHAGDRLPWLQFPDNPKSPYPDNFAPLSSLDWQVHIYSTWTCPDIGRLSFQRKLAFHVFPWQPSLAASGIVENAVYLIRPDGYIAFADPPAKARTLAAYLDTQGLTFA